LSLVAGNPQRGIRGSFRTVLVPDAFHIPAAATADGILAAIDDPGEARDIV
jgi:hypothetical protein